VNGRGLSELKSALWTVLSGLPPPRDIAKPRLPVDRVFTLHGIGRVVTGTLHGGWLKRGQTVVVQPSGKATRIRSLQNHNRDVEMSEPGSRTALNLPDAGGSTPPHGIGGVRRGDVITLPELGAASGTLDVLLEMSPRPVSGKKVQPRPLKDGTQVRVHHGSVNFPAWIHFFDVPAMGSGEGALAQLRFGSPIFALLGDRFIIRDSEQATVGGGVVLDPEATRKKFRAWSRTEFLKERAQSPNALPVLMTSQLLRDRAIRRASFLLKSRCDANEIAAALTGLLTEKKARLAGEWG
jgi:selenocysteine-specific elongation factor